MHNTDNDANGTLSIDTIISSSKYQYDMEIDDISTGTQPTISYIDSSIEYLELMTESEEDNEDNLEEK